jgi:hypothetical protein
MADRYFSMIAVHFCTLAAPAVSRQIAAAVRSSRGN